MRTGLARIELLRVALDCFVFFFFQAEDGIRDPLVTGVQTCALPISRILPPRGGTRTVSFPAAPTVSTSPAPPGAMSFSIVRSEERRVGKECRSRGSRYH